MDLQPDLAIYERVRKLQDKAWRADRRRRYALYASIAGAGLSVGGLIGFAVALLSTG